MPSDVLKASTPSAPPANDSVGEPPSVKLIVRLFVIPLAIVSLAVGVMFLISLMAGGTPTIDEALQRLRAPGGNRTADLLVGPAAKQRYMVSSDGRRFLMNTIADESPRPITIILNWLSR